MELTFEQFKVAIEARIEVLEAMTPTPQILADIQTLEVLLGRLP